MRVPAGQAARVNMWKVGTWLASARWVRPRRISAIAEDTVKLGARPHRYTVPSDARQCEEPEVYRHDRPGRKRMLPAEETMRARGWGVGTWINSTRWVRAREIVSLEPPFVFYVPPAREAQRLPYDVHEVSAP